MAVDKKISQLTSLAQVDVSASTDVLPIVDTSAVETKKITVSALVGAGATAGISGAVLTNGTINSTTIGATTPSTGAFTTLSASGAVSLNPANANVSLAPTGTGVVTINPATAGTMNNVAIGGSSAAAGTFTSATVSTGNLTFSSTGQRITGDLSNATLANRLAFQTSTTNGLTGIYAIPNGTAQTAIWGTYNSSDTTNCSGFDLTVTPSEARLRNFIVGTGTYLPMTFYTGGSERMRLDTSGNLGIGTASPGSRLHVATSAAEIARYASSAANGGYQIFYPDNGVTPVYVGSQKAILATGNATDFAIVGTGANNMVFGTNSAERMRIDSSGNVGIGTASPGSRVTLGVNATDTALSGTSNTAGLHMYVRAFGVAQIDSIQSGANNSGMSLRTYNNGTYTAFIENTQGNTTTFATAGTTRMTIDSSGNVGIGGTADAYAKTQIKGNLPASGGTSVSYDTQAVITSSATSSAIMYESFPSVQNASFTLPILYHFIAAQGTKGASATVTNQYGFFAGSSLTGATNNYGFYSDIASGTNRWNFYAAGTANNYFAGNTGVGSTDVSITRLRVTGAGATSATYATYMDTSGGAQLFSVRNDGAFFTGTHTNSPYNLTTASAANCFINADGALYRSTSSLRYKTDVADAAHGLADVLKLRSVTYKGKNDGDKTFGGLIAEEVHDAGLTEFVAYDKEGRPDALHYGNMVALLVKAVQELKAELEALKAA